MIILSLINELLKKECIQELLIQYENDSILKQITQNDFKKLCETKLNQKLPLEFMKQNFKDQCKYPSEKRCCARIWSGHYGNRCSYQRKLNTDYCLNHNKMIQRDGKLIFNRYDQERPILNEKGNRIPWFNISHLQMLDTIIQKQAQSFQKLIQKNRKITPKI
tara:strand:+ start:108 stop:596 length:489 start_codon:yes stop_codon:yes gene_type:complete